MKNKIELQREFIAEKKEKKDCLACLKLIDIIEERESWLKSNMARINTLSAENRGLRRMNGELELERQEMPKP